jgi:hypothetical protein
MTGRLEMKTRKMRNNGQFIWLAILAALIMCIVSDLMYASVDDSDQSGLENHSICERGVV